MLGLADHNPHGLALLQCYRYGSIRSSIEGRSFGMYAHQICLSRPTMPRILTKVRSLFKTKCGPFKVCDLRWMGLRASQIKAHQDIGVCGERLSRNDLQVWQELRRNVAQESAKFREEVEEMNAVGKYELQWLYGHSKGMNYFTFGFIETAILRGDYL